MVNPALTLELPGDVTMSFQRIPTESDPKPFRLGERGLGDAIWGFSDPVVRVCLTRPFYLSTFPVTQAQFEVFTKAEGIDHTNVFDGHSCHPAESMDWRRALAYCEWLTRVASGQMPSEFTLACLPTEAEWEYACRAGTDTEYYTGDGEAALAEAGWYAGNAGGSTQPVGGKQPNAFGLYDLHGNVWEWCHDAWGQAPYRDRVDGDGDPLQEQRLKDWQADLDRLTESDQTRVLRGGSWCNTARNCRSASRNWDWPGVRLRILGFRVCLVRGPAPGRGAPADRRAEPAPGDGGRGTRPESDGVGAAAAPVPDQAQANFPREAGRKKIEK